MTVLSMKVWRSHLTGAIGRGARLALVAHSFGGVVTMALAKEFEEDFQKAVVAVAMTDSVDGSYSLSEVSSRGSVVLT